MKKRRRVKVVETYKFKLSDWTENRKKYSVPLSTSYHIYLAMYLANLQQLEEDETEFYVLELKDVEEIGDNVRLYFGTEFFPEGKRRYRWPIPFYTHLDINKEEIKGALEEKGLDYETYLLKRYFWRDDVLYAISWYVGVINSKIHFKIEEWLMEEVKEEKEIEEGLPF